MKFGIGARAGYVTGVEHLVARPEPRGFRTDLFHNPSGIEAEDAANSLKGPYIRGQRG